MNQQTWDVLCERIQQLDPECERWQEPLAEGHAGTQEVLEFMGGAGRMRIVRTSRPAVTSVQHQYSHRGGATANTTYTYSDTEVVHAVKVYREVAGEWEEVKLTELGI